MYSRDHRVSIRLCNRAVCKAHFKGFSIDFWVEIRKTDTRITSGRLERMASKGLAYHITCRLLWFFLIFRLLAHA